MNLFQLFAVLAVVESGGDPACVGDNGEAYGIYQIHECVITDVNNHYRVNYKHADAFDPKTAAVIANFYLDIYATPERLGHAPTVEDCARIWNGGPNGYKKKATLGYWKRFREVALKKGYDPDGIFIDRWN